MVSTDSDDSSILATTNTIIASLQENRSNNFQMIQIMLTKFKVVTEMVVRNTDMVVMLVVKAEGEVHQER